MTALVAIVLSMFSVLVPQKAWYTPDQPLNVTVKSPADATLVLTDFTGKAIESGAPTDVTAGQTVDVRAMFPPMAHPGCYVLYAVAKGSQGVGASAKFLGTPLVIDVRQDSRRGAGDGPMVIKVEPLRYAVMTTDSGPMTFAFYYDVAPLTVDSFLDLADGGYFDGLVFHRIVPGFVIQGGDPLGSDPARAGTGGPGYHVEAEFNDRPHEAGVLSMARSGDPNEQFGAEPRPEFANSAGSQFFICLDYARTRALDHKYTAFGRVLSGMDVVNKIASANVQDPSTGRPDKPQVIQKVEVVPVTEENNPYATMFNVEPASAGATTASGATTQPSAK